jgi:predicted O-linked N-acetylglucosamine transferase (SPINDLY family)
LRERLLNGLFDTLIGTVARTEKIADPRFLACVVRILSAHPRALFVWTGHHQDRTVQGLFEQNGVAEQTRFIGWVDTILHANALDVLLDSFPLCNGVTALQAMAAGTPVVSINRNTSFLGRDIVPIVEQNGAPAVAEAAALCDRIRSAFQTRDAIPAADDEDDYVRIANALIDDNELRQRTGAALRFIAANLYANEALMALLFETHILDLVRNQQALGHAA